MRFATANPAGMPFRAPATASRPTAVLTSPCIAMGSTKAAAREQQLAHAYDMAEVTWSDIRSSRPRAWRGTPTCRGRSSRFCSTPADGVGCAPLAQAI
jgi:hypothetical protein